MVTSQAHILLVEDQPRERERIRKMLGELGYAVTEASGGEEALQILSPGPAVDLVLSDVFMRAPDGLQLLKVCASNYPSLPVVLMSRKSTRRVLVEALRAGASDYLIKPFARQELAAVLDRVEALRRAPKHGAPHPELIRRIELDFRCASATLSVEKMQKIVASTIRHYTRMPANDLLNLSIALEESLLNAHEHGNLELKSAWKEERQPGRSESRFEAVKQERLQTREFAERKVAVKLVVTPDKVSVSVKDDGAGYHAGKIARRVSGKPYGMGLMLIKNLTDHTSFNEKGNEVTFEKRIDSPAAISSEIANQDTRNSRR